MLSVLNHIFRKLKLLKDPNETFANWDKKRLSRLLTQLAISKSIAVNFDDDKWSGLIPVDADDLGAHDLHEIQEATIRRLANKRKSLQARFSTPINSHPSQPVSEESVLIGESIACEKDEHANEKNASPQSPSPIELREGREEAEAAAGAFISTRPKGPSEPPTNVPSTHSGIDCDGCTVDPISGIRWKCLRCTDYNLCNKCYGTGAHEHKEFLKIEDPEDYKSWHSIVGSPFTTPF